MDFSEWFICLDNRVTACCATTSFRHALSRNPAGPPAFGLFERRALTLKSDKSHMVISLRARVWIPA